MGDESPSYGAERDDMTEIVVGLDVSVPAQAALVWAATQARLTGQHLRAVSAVFPWGNYLAAGGYIPLPMPSQEVDDHQRDMIKKIYAAVQPDPSWKLDFITDDPGPALVAASRSAALLVIGTREHTGWGRLLNGSVSYYCLSHAHCPVLAVPVERTTTVAGDDSASSVKHDAVGVGG
jgi:nucleotide-binding universal stress UspA family protein